MKTGRSWWDEAGELMARKPSLAHSAKGIRGFAGGAAWMREAMTTVGWRMPPFRREWNFNRLGWIKYGICSILSVIAALLAWRFAHAVFVPPAALLVFYATEAQAVFLFPEKLLGRRHAWRSSRALTCAAGGTFRVMGVVIAIAARMLGGGWRNGRFSEAWVRGCLAVVLWHRHVSFLQSSWVEDAGDLPLGEIGTTSPLLLRLETVGTGQNIPFRVLWISDLHWHGWQDVHILLSLRDIARRKRPDVCILGGDFLERTAAAPLLKLLVRSLRRICPVVALPGNHDRGRFLTLVPETIRSAGGAWLPDTGSVEVTNKQGTMMEIVAAGAKASGDGKRRIIAVHDPAELDAFSPSPASIILAGHLHGGQWVIGSRAGRLFPAAVLYRHAWLRRTFREAEWIISRGAGDTLPLRWNCPREAILCDIS